jgi:hypothetical protein
MSMYQTTSQRRELVDHASKSHLRAPLTLNLRRLWLRVRIWFIERDIDNLNHLIDRINYERSVALHDRQENAQEIQRLRKQL